LVPVPCNKYNNYNAQEKIIISAPLYPITPSVVMLSSPQIFSCDKITIDATGSYGSAGRAWKSIVWSVTRSDGNSTDLLIDYLNLYFPSTSSLISIPSNSTLVQVGVYTFYLKLENIFGKSSISSIFVNVIEPISIPQVSISGPSVVSFTRPNVLSLFSLGSLFVCGKELDGALVYSWKVYKGIQLDPSISSSSLDPRQFKLPAYNLDINQQYTFSIKASLLKDPSLSAKATVTVNVGVSGVLAQIKGGSVRTALETDVLVLDASESYDLDYPTAKNRLTYSWSCSEYSPSYGNACPSALELKPQAINTFEAGTIVIFEPTSYLFTVTVMNSFGATNSFQTIINLVKDAIPLVSVANVNGKLNPENKLTLSGFVTVPTDQIANAIWSSSDISSSYLKSIALTPISSSFPSATTSNFQLTLSPGALTPGATYTFTLTASRNNFPIDKSYSTLTIQVNAPPVGGSVMVDPTEGAALSTSFTLLTTSWSDDPNDYPLTYAIGYYTTDPNIITTVKPYSQGTSIESLLGQGLDSMGNKVICIAYAKDTYGSSGSASTSVIVTAASSDPEILSNITSSVISSALKSGNTDAIGLVVSAATDAINSVDCSSSPDCFMLNRNNCSSTINTCGTCLNGYLGVMGDSNEACLLSSSSQRRLTTESNEKLQILELFHQLSTPNNQKSCPNSCSGNGQCVYLDSKDLRIPSCLQTSFTCQARCLCDTNWTASDCSISSNNVTGIRSLKENLCSTMLSTVDMQDISTSLISERSEKVASLLIDPLQITNVGFQNCTDFLLKTIEKDFTSASIVIANVYSALSTILDGDYYGMLPSSMLSDIVSTIKILSQYRQNQLVFGENDPSFIDPNGKDNFRVSVKNEYYSELASSTILSPLSPLEFYYNVKPSITNMKSSNISNDNRLNGIGLSVIQFSRNILGLSYQNYSYLELAYNFQNIQSKSLISDLISSSTLQNDFNFVPMYPVTGIAYCEVFSSPYKLQVGCPKSNETVNCDGNPAIVYYNCPANIIAPVCSNINPATNSSVICSTQSYFASNSSCECSMVPKANLPYIVDIQLVSYLSEISKPFSSIITPFKNQTITFTQVFFKISGLSTSLFESSIILQTALRLAISSDLGLPIASITLPISNSVQAASIRDRNKLKASIITVEVIITSVLSSNDILTKLANTLSTLTATFISNAIANGYIGSLAGVSILSVSVQEIVNPPTPSPTFNSTLSPESSQNKSKPLELIPIIVGTISVALFLAYLASPRFKSSIDKLFSRADIEVPKTTGDDNNERSLGAADEEENEEDDDDEDNERENIEPESHCVNSICLCGKSNDSKTICNVCYTCTEEPTPFCGDFDVLSSGSSLEVSEVNFELEESVIYQPSESSENTSSQVNQPGNRTDILNEIFKDKK